MHRLLNPAGKLLISVLLTTGCANSAPTTAVESPASIDKARTRPHRFVHENPIIGVGLAVGTNKNAYPWVRNVITPSPASTAGIMEGDKILAVDGESVFDKTVDEVVNRIRGVEQTQVELIVEHSGQSRTVSLTRQLLMPGVMPSK